MLVGKTGAGKTSFCQAMEGESLHYRKTQAVQVINNAIDTPGEFVENRVLYRALITSGADADVLVLVQDCTDESCMFAPGFTTMFGKPAIGLVSKIDLVDDETKISEAEEKLELAGCERIFRISNSDLRGIDAVKAYIGIEPVVEDEMPADGADGAEPLAADPDVATADPATGTAEPVVAAAAPADSSC